jgi:subtilisin family serine protease
VRDALRRAAALLAAVALAAPAAAQDLATLRATAEADGRVRVLVELATPTRPEARLGAASLQAQRARIAAAQAAVLTTAGPDARTTRRYAALPLVGLEVGPAALQALARDANVARVFPDRRNYPTLGATVPRVGAPDAWALGFDGAGTTVAVLDTGVDADHPTFDGTTVREACFSTHAPESGVTSLCEDFATEAVGPGAAAPRASPPPPTSRRSRCSPAGRPAGARAPPTARSRSTATFWRGSSTPSRTRTRGTWRRSTSASGRPRRTPGRAHRRTTRCSATFGPRGSA